jgi:hypothetical protein
MALVRLFWLWIAWERCYSGHQEGGEYDDFLFPHNVNESAHY